MNPPQEPTSWVYMTSASLEEARRIGKALVQERLVACVNLLPGMESLYWWEGEVTQGQEVVLVAKTPSRLVPALTTRVKALHSYSCPCVVAVPIEQGNPDYLSWIVEETRQK